MNDLLTNGTTGSYEGSLTDKHGPMRVLGHHPALNGDVGARYIIALLNGLGNAVGTLSNVRRESLTNTTASTR